MADVHPVLALVPEAILHRDEPGGREHHALGAAAYLGPARARVRHGARTSASEPAGKGEAARFHRRCKPASAPRMQSRVKTQALSRCDQPDYAWREWLPA